VSALAALADGHTPAELRAYLTAAEADRPDLHA
jgi:hypothetical protein